MENYNLSEEKAVYLELMKKVKVAKKETVSIEEAKQKLLLNIIIALILSE